jgi:hypothetical protein
LVEQGAGYSQTVAEATKLKLDMDNPADREKLRRAVFDLVSGRKMAKQKRPGKIDIINCRTTTRGG